MRRGQVVGPKGRWSERLLVRRFVGPKIYVRDPYKRLLFRNQLFMAYRTPLVSSEHMAEYTRPHKEFHSNFYGCIWVGLRVIQLFKPSPSANKSWLKKIDFFTVMEVLILTAIPHTAFPLITKLH